MAEIPVTRVSLLMRLRNPQDEVAWRDFVSLYGPLVYGYLRKQGLQDADAADLSQDVFRAVTAGVKRLVYDPDRGHFRSWLFQVVRRKLSNWRRDQGVRQKNFSQCNVQELPNEVLEEHPSEDVWEAEWERRVFAWACELVRNEVAEKTWNAFWRTAIDGEPGKQVADELKLSLASVYHARSRIRARLQDLIRSAQEP